MNFADGSENLHHGENCLGREKDARPILAPGCFGVPRLFSPTAPECSQCPFSAECEAVEASTRRYVEAELAPEFAAKDAKNKAGQNERQARSREKRAFKPPSPESVLTDALKAERERREGLLAVFLAVPALDRRFRKLKGRARDVSFVWLARELAVAFNKPGKKPSAQSVADALGFIPGAHDADRYQIGRDLHWVEEFESELWRLP